jgi:hypothetical protein
MKNNRLAELRRIAHELGVETLADPQNSKLRRGRGAHSGGEGRVGVFEGVTDLVKNVKVALAVGLRNNAGLLEQVCGVRDNRSVRQVSMEAPRMAPLAEK